MARIVVIGAGMGGMAAAARLAVAGHDVVVHERSDTHGGAVQRYARDGFAFDTGPGLLHLPAVYRDLFLKTGREPLEDRVELVRVPVTARHVFPDGGRVTLPNASRGKVRAALDEALGAGAGEHWAGMLNRAREAWEATRRPLLEEPLRDEPSSRGALERDGAYPAPPPKGLRRLRRRPRQGSASGPTLAQLADDELRDPRLAAMLCGCAWSHGLDPATAPAGAARLAYLEDAFGTWYVKGGMRALADALYARCEQRRVTFRFGSAVTGVREKDGRAAGVELADGSGVEADVVVAGTAPGTLAGWPEGHRAAGPGMARLTVLLALRGARPEGTPHRTLVHRAEAPGQPLTVLRPDDPALRPDDAHETAVLSLPLATASPTGSAGSGSPGSAVAMDSSAGRAGGRDRLAAGGVWRRPTRPGWAGRALLWHEVRTPADNEAETGAP
ncbi:NAD(P)/FAD-dependent oxidoreductase, partial [Streptomyces albus subsp. chlorinus]|uniref:phytoene desaturase family protein n=1 Tax=Streptomyces albus TaxID=1888 RepID=UPI00156EE139